MRTVALSIVRGSTEERVSLLLPDHPVTLAQFARCFYAVSDEISLLSRKEEEERGGRISCQTGCAHCCKQLVPLSGAEAFALYEVLLLMAEEVRERVLSKFQSRREKVHNTWIGYALRNHMAHDETRARELAIAYHRLQLACPFLEQDLCLIYDGRPFDCRQYLVTTRKEACRFLGKAEVRSVPQPIYWRDVLSYVSSKALGYACERIALLDAYDWAKEHEQDRMRLFSCDELLVYMTEFLQGQVS